MSIKSIVKKHQRTKIIVLELSEGRGSRLFWSAGLFHTAMSFSSSTLLSQGGMNTGGHMQKHRKKAPDERTADTHEALSSAEIALQVLLKCRLRILDAGACVVKVQSQPDLHNDSHLHDNNGGAV